MPTVKKTAGSHPDLESVLITEAAIRRRIKKLGADPMRNLRWKTHILDMECYSHFPCPSVIVT